MDNTLSADQIHAELDSIALHLLTLSQDLVKSKLELEERTKQGFMGLAQSRKLMGGQTSVSHLQFPSEESSGFTARYTTKNEECIRSDNGHTRFNYFSLNDSYYDELVQNIDSALGVQKRKKERKEGESGDAARSAKDSSKPKDPINWFGVLVPSALRQTQVSFNKSVQLSVECANIQNEIGGAIARKKFLLRQLKKCPKPDPV